MMTSEQENDVPAENKSVDDSWLQSPERTAVFQSFIDSLEDRAVRRAKIKGIDSNYRPPPK